MRWARFLLCFFLLFGVCTVAVSADTDELYRRQAQAAGVEDLPRHLPADLQELLEQTQTDLLDPSTYNNLSLQQVLDLLGALLTEQSVGPMQALRMLVGVVLISALLGGLNFGDAPTLRRSYHGVAVLGAGGILLPALMTLLNTVGETVDSVTVFLTAFSPVFAAILAVGGRAAGAVAYQATLLGAAGLLGWLIRLLVFPLLSVSLAFGCVGTVTDGFCLDRISGGLHKAVLWALGLFSAVFSGVLSVHTSSRKRL